MATRFESAGVAGVQAPWSAEGEKIGGSLSALGLEFPMARKLGVRVCGRAELHNPAPRERRQKN
jgi:hypothetical protein